MPTLPPPTIFSFSPIWHEPFDLVASHRGNDGNDFIYVICVFVTILHSLNDAKCARPYAFTQSVST